jgi:DNA-binding IclR family transcriptional regulator
MPHRDPKQAQANFGSTIDGLFVSACVVMGHAENRPMTATKIAHYLRMPRTTVLRKLDELEKLNMIERRGTVFVIPAKRGSTSSHVERSVKLIKRYTKILDHSSILDTQTSDPSKTDT